MQKSKRKLPRPFKMPWGKGDIVKEAGFSSEHHEPTVQLMKFKDGNYVVRFAHYNHKGAFQRSPLMISAKELKNIKKSLQQASTLKKLLSLMIE